MPSITGITTTTVGTATTTTTSSSSSNVKSKLDYLSKYTDTTVGGEAAGKTKKKKKHKKDKKGKQKQPLNHNKHTQERNAYLVHDEEDDLVRGLPPPPDQGDDSDDEAPVVVSSKGLPDPSLHAHQPPPRGTWDAEDTGSSPPRRRRRPRHDSDNDDEDANNEEEEERRPRRRYDSSEDDTPSSRTSRTGKRQRHDSDNENEKDDKKVKREDTDSEDSDSDRQSRRRYDSEEEDKNDKDENDKARKMSSGHKAGLQHYKDFNKSEQHIQAQKQQDAQLMVDKYGMGETVYRGTDDSAAAAATAAGKKRIQPLPEDQQKALNTGAVQKERAHAQEREFQRLHTSSFARHRDDDQLEAIRKQEIRKDDPMAAHAAKKQQQRQQTTTTTTGGTTSILPPSKPLYKGPPPKPNRYNIRPGYRWDGVDRGNGWEDKLLAKQFSATRRNEQAYRWRSADM
jgi:pre-mRNA-splicing factor CWC26